MAALVSSVTCVIATYSSIILSVVYFQKRSLKANFDDTVNLEVISLQ